MVGAAIVDQGDQCGTNPDPSFGRRAADWIEFLTSHPELDASEPVSVDFGTVTGQQVELAVTEGSTTSCPDNRQLLRGPPDAAGRRSPKSVRAALEQRLLISVVDVGDRTVVMQTYGSSDPDEFTASIGVIRDLIATFRFD